MSTTVMPNAPDTASPDERLAVRLASRVPVRVEDGVLVLVDERIAMPAASSAPPFRRAAFAAAARVADHPVACACCQGRAPFARVLGGLFAERARGEVPFFSAIVAVSDMQGRNAARGALATDPFLRARYRLEPAPPSRRDHSSPPR